MCPNKKVAAIFVNLFRNGEIIKRIEYGKEPLRLNPFVHGRFTEITVDLFHIDAMNASGLPIDPDKVKYFSKFKKISVWLNETDGCDTITSSPINLNICNDCDPDVDLSDEEEDLKDKEYSGVFVNVMDHCENLSDVKCLIIGLGRKRYKPYEGSELPESDDDSEGETNEPPEKKAKE